MKVNVKIKSVRNYVQLLNGIFNLTPREMDVISRFIEVGDLSNDSKVFVSNQEKITINTLNLYVAKLIKKRAIVKNKGKYIITPLLNFNEELTFVCQKNY
jgi:hypothetical protein